MNTACAIALVLLLDASGSVRPEEWDTLLNAHADAIESSDVSTLITRAGGISVRATEFSDATKPLTEWTVLLTEADAAAYARGLRAARRTLTGGTATGDAIAHALRDLDAAPCGDHQIIDVATDGPSNAGQPVSIPRDRATSMAVTINVLAITTRYGDQTEWMRQHVATQDGFVLRADGWQDVARAVRRKIALEIAGGHP